MNRFFGRFYLDQEKDIIVDLYKDREELSYVLSTPNHSTGNLIRNLAKLCDLPLSTSEYGLLVIEGKVPCYITADGSEIYIFRLGGTKVANIYPDGRIEMKASIPSISKTLMSQTKNYELDIARTIIKTYILSDCKFKTDLHTHMNANLHPDVLIALGIYHQIRYPLYYIKKLDLGLSMRQRAMIETERRKVAKRFEHSPLTGKYLTRRIDDNTFINFADLMLRNPEHVADNIPKIRASLAVLKDGQAVFTNLEKVYLYRYVFTKGIPSEKKIQYTDFHVGRIPDADIVYLLNRMREDHAAGPYENNSLFQDKLLWIARSYAKRRIRYVEITDTTLVKKNAAEKMLAEVHAVMPAVMAETGVMIRFLAGIRRIPLTIVKDQIAPDDYLKENLQVLRAVSRDPYVAGSDIIGEEINDIREIRPVIKEIVSIAAEDPSFVVRIHAGENDSLPGNVANSIECVTSSLAPGQKMPHMRIGHGLYTQNLRSAKGHALLAEIKKRGVVLEFQITSNVRLNNLSQVAVHPLKQYLRAGIGCVQGTDGAALYGTDSIDEQLSLEKLLGLTPDDLRQMCRTEDQILRYSEKAFRDKTKQFEAHFEDWKKDHPDDPSIAGYYAACIREAAETTRTLFLSSERLDTAEALAAQVEDLPDGMVPIVLAGGSFNNDRHKTVLKPEYKDLIDQLLAKANPKRIYFVIGNSFSGYEKYLLEQNLKAAEAQNTASDHPHGDCPGKFRIYAFTPVRVTKEEAAKISAQPVRIRVAIEPSSMGLYKSIAYEVFKRRPSILLALDGNSAGANLIQEAKNAKYPCRICINPHAKTLKAKADSLQGYVTLLEARPDMAEDILP